jgi:hypothetical protein
MLTRERSGKESGQMTPTELSITLIASVFGLSGWVVCWLLWIHWKEDTQVWFEIWDSRDKEYHNLKRYLEELEKDV